MKLVHVLSYLLLLRWAVVAATAAALGADKRSCATGPHNYPAPAANNSLVVSSKQAASTRGAAPERFLVHWKTSIFGNGENELNNNITSNNTVITVEIIREWSPIGADRFFQLVLDNFYNCATFFRVVPNFIVQFGIAADPEETAKWDVAIADDNVSTANIQSNAAGTLTYATAGANTRTSQIFVNLQDNAHLDKQGFAPFGRVLTGMGALLHQVYNPTPGKSGGIAQDELMAKGNEWLLQEHPEVDLIWTTLLEIPSPQDNTGSGKSEYKGEDIEGENDEDEAIDSENDDEAFEDENDDENDDEAFEDENDDKDSEDLNDDKAYDEDEDYENENDDEADEDQNDDESYENENDDESFEDENDDDSDVENEKSALGDVSESYDSSGGESGLDAYGNSFADEESKRDNNDDNFEDEMNSSDDEALFGDDNVEEFVETNLKVEQKNRVWIVLAVILEVALLLYCMKR